LTPTILCMTPYRPDCNLGAANNEAMSLLPEDGWGVLRDHDAEFTTSIWWRQIAEAIAFKPNAGLFTVVTNRIASRWQRAGNPDCKDQDEHERLGRARAEKNRTLLDVTETKGIGGVVIVTSKRAWASVGGFVDGMMCTDHVFHFAQRAAGRRIYLMENLYVSHRRTTSSGEAWRKMPFAANCPCRGPENDPTERIALP